MIGPLLVAVLLVQGSVSQEWHGSKSSNVEQLESSDENPKNNVEIITDLNTIKKPNDKPFIDEGFNREDYNDKLNFDFNFDGALQRKDGFKKRSIRLKRSAAPSSTGDEPKQLETFQSITIGNPKDQIELTDANHSNDKQRTSKMLLHEVNDVVESSREPRGATKEQWIRQPYPVRVTNENSYDNLPASSDEVRAPRVHFVTQKRAEASPPAVYKNAEREGRGRDFQREEAKEVARPAPKKLPRTQERDRPIKQHYDPFRSFNPYRDEPYYRFEESRYNPQFAHDSSYEAYRPDFSSHRQRRIIYYATLPEVVRTPPNVNLRDRYNYRDRYDEGYVDYPSLLPESTSYRFDKPYTYYNARYETDMERPKPYPLKVSTDLNVREAKKNPERRIYSEGERRYAYKLPYEAEDDFDRTI